MNDFLANILGGINTVVGNYGWSIVVFTVLIKLVLFPFDYKSRKSMRRMTSLQPQIAKLQKKYANDKEKLNMKTTELYRKENINPMSGCVPMLITMPVLFAMFAAMRVVANTELAKQAIDLITTGVQSSEGWLWVKNLWMPDSPFSAIIPDENSLKMIPADIWQKVFNALDGSVIEKLAGLGDGLAITIDNISGESIFAALKQIDIYESELALWGTMPNLNLLFVNLPIYARNNGWFILPVLSAATQLLMTITQPQQAAAPTTEGQAAGTGKFMKYFFPLFSLYICSSYNAAFAIYWVASNVIAAVQGFALTKYFEAKDKKNDEEVLAGEGSLK